MKKIKRFALHSGINSLTDYEQMNLFGGTSAAITCGEKSYEECSGFCSDEEGHEGTCGWTSVYERCTCAIIYIG